ncbi:MAG TPA: glycosyltransferase family A protein [Candidatus Saccharimonadales bacterium]|nr:glycosyltransferase family A protein [Candidatus Saccharimonadales bacterium]
MFKELTLSIVIPVYNEENHVKACLQAIAAQTAAPDEVILVDNNSTDRTLAIARQFKFVKIIHEPVQGLIAARNAGFNQARSDLVARIDADAAIAPDWVERVKKDFLNPQVAAITGPAMTRTVRSDWLPRSRLWSVIYFWWTEAEFGIPILWGANMVLRRSAWLKVRGDVCLDDMFVHEDQDLSFLLAGANKKVMRDNRLLMATSDKSYHEWVKFSEYVCRRWQTRRYHTARQTVVNSPLRLGLMRRLRRLTLIILILPIGIIFLGASILPAILDFVLPAAPQPANLPD